jgi:hypothetical protein
MYGHQQLLQFFNQLLLSISSHRSYTETRKTLVKNLDPKQTKTQLTVQLMLLFRVPQALVHRVSSLTRKPLIKFTFTMCHTGRSFVAGLLVSERMTSLVHSE